MSAKNTNNESGRSSVFVTAEIGINHNGDIGITKRLIDLACFAGCDAVKFQKRTLDLVYPREYLDSPRESPWGTTQREQKEGLEFGQAEYDQIDAYCRQKGIHWFASAWDCQSQRFLRRHDLKYNKIASAMLTNMELVEMVASEGKHTFVSTGMSTMEEIGSAVDVFRKRHCPFELMHTVSTYPMTNEDANLSCIHALREAFGCDVGYSGHEVGLQITLAAVAMGATSVERHITLDRTMYGSDQAASVEAGGLIRLVRDIRVIERACGDGVKRICEGEVPIREKLREQLAAVGAERSPALARSA